MAGRTTRRRPDPAVLALVAAGGALVWVMGSGRRRRGPARPSVTAPDGEFGEAPFPPVKQKPQWTRLSRLARAAEQTTGMKGLFSYLLATAKGESAGVPSAMNTKTDATPAFRLLCRSMNFERRFSENPWRPTVCDPSDPLAPRWSYSGGWFQMMPVVALATSDGRGLRHDPARVFDPPFAVAYATDLVRDLKVHYGAKTWGDIRAGWALPKWARPTSDANGKAVVLERFSKRLGQVASMGADPGLATKTFQTTHYPGFGALLHALLAADGRTGTRVA